MKRIVKSVPSKNYRSDYDLSVGLIERIAQDSSEPWSASDKYPLLIPDEVLDHLVNGKTVTVLSPFKAEVHWTLETDVKDGPAVVADFAEKLIEHAIMAFGDKIPISDIERRNHVLNYHVGMIRLLEATTNVAVDVMKHVTPRQTEAEVETHNEAAEMVEPQEPKKNRYSVEQQADKSWAIFNGGGFVKGGYYSRNEAVQRVSLMITADIEAGVPVDEEIG